MITGSVRRGVLAEDLRERSDVWVGQDADFVEVAFVVGALYGGDLLSEFEELAEELDGGCRLR